MKNFEDEIFNLPEDINIEASPMTEEEIQKIYSIELSKISNKNKHTKKSSIRILLIASILTFGAMTVFASYSKISNIFAGVFKEKNVNGEIVSIEKNIPVIEKAGAIIDKSISANGLDVSIRGVVGDDDTVYLMIDVVDPSGNPLKSANNESESSRQLKFDSAYLNIGTPEEENFAASGQYCWTDSIKIDNNKATFLINEKINHQNIVGKKATLILKDLMDYVAPKPKDIDMTYKNLYDIYTQFKEEAIFITEETPDELNMLVAIDENGQMEPILKSGNEKIKFSNKFKDLYITNMAFKDNKLYMNFFLDSNEKVDKYLSLAFKNINTGEIAEIYTGSSSVNMDNGINVSSELNITCDKITSAEQLKDYIIVTDAEYRFEPVVEGEWKFEFNLDYENTTEIYKINQQLNLNVGTLYCEEVEVSPISINMKLKTDIQDIDLISDIGLIMNDGSSVDDITNPHYSYEYNDETKIGYLRCILPYVISPSDIKNIKIENSNIYLN